MTRRFGALISAAALLLLIAAPVVQAQTNMYMDFDDDNDPWTLRQNLPAGTTTALVKFVLEVGADMPLGAEIWGSIEEGCCNGMDYMHHYGTLVNMSTIQFDPLYLSAADIGLPVCLECCPSMFFGQISPNAPVSAGQRYFVGQAEWNAYCYELLCSAPTDFTFSLVQGIGGVSHMVFTCAPVSSSATTWGSLKAVYR